MADIKWIKIVTDIFDDEKILLIEAMPDSYAIIVCWFKLLCFAGNQNNNGVMMLNDKIAYTDEMLATIFRMNLNTVKLALGVFEHFGMIVVADDVIKIKNWQKYQSFKDKATYNEYMSAYMKKRYHKQKQLEKGVQEENFDILNKNLNKNLNDFNSEEIRIKEDKNKEDKNKEDKNTKADKSAELQETLDTIKNAELIEALKEFIAYRKEIKHPVTPHALKLLIGKLNKLASTDAERIEILNQSMVNGWQGIFALDKRKQSNQRTEHYDSMDKTFMDGEIV